MRKTIHLEKDARIMFFSKIVLLVQKNSMFTQHNIVAKVIDLRYAANPRKL